MKSLTLLWKVLAQDMGERCSVDTTRDALLVARRAENEGEDFLTITLPDFGKAFESWLERGQVDLNDVPGFKGRHGLPVFLSGFLGQVFSYGDGVIWENPCIDSILAVRQLCGVFGKMFRQASAKRTLDAMEGFLRTESELKEATIDPQELLEVRRVFRLLFGRVLDDLNNVIGTCRADSMPRPRHGPGATADALRGNAKWSMDWTWRLEEYFPSDLYLLPNHRYVGMLDSVTFRLPEEELPVRVISVPKTAKTPRIIAIEPTCMQYTQQALARVLTESLETENIVKGLVGFSDQVPNQVLAREGSLTGSLATLDLSEASDRVSNSLVLSLFEPWGHLSGAIQACRSTRAKVRLDRVIPPDQTGEEDDGGEFNYVVVDLVKFASMGSALTFPIEAMVFLTCVFRGIERDLGRHLRARDVIAARGSVRVYGDDILVPVDHVGSVIHTLESFGAKVNSRKSFWTGKFRESCGKDYFAGTDVSIVRFRQMWPDDRRSAEEVVALVSFFNQCSEAQYTHTTRYLRKELVGLLGTFPRVSRTSPILGEVVDHGFTVDAVHRHYQTPLAKGWLVVAHLPANPLDGERALLKWFLKEGAKPLDENHLLHSGRPRVVSIKRGMGSV